MPSQAIQDLYPDHFSHCYGCGRLNEHGLHIKSILEGEEVVCTLSPKPYHLAVPGFVYGGLIASIIDCHSIGTAAALEYFAGGGQPPATSPERFVTKSLHVDFLKPTPVDAVITVRARLGGRRGKERVVQAQLYSAGELRARGEVVAVPVPEYMLPGN